MKKEIDNFYIISEYLDDNLYLVIFALHYYHYKDVGLSKLKDYVENQNLNKINDGVETLLDLKMNEIRSFKNKFNTLFGQLQESDSFSLWLETYNNLVKR